MDVSTIASHFSYPGVMKASKPFGSGHINDTFLLTYETGAERCQYILRRINQTVFTRPRELIENTECVCHHIEEKLAEERPAESARRVLKLVPAGAVPWYQDEAGEYWCSYRFVDKTVAIDTVQNLDQAYQAARAFGKFQGQLADLDPDQVVETIPDFHHLLKRYETFEKALEVDAHGRCSSVQEEIDFVMSRKALADRIMAALADRSLPIRVIHNDTKVNNVLLDEDTGEGMCVIDLDTVMPGTVIYDFGDMVRTFTSPAAEDEQDLSKIRMRMEVFEALTRGYLEEANEFLNDTERSMLVYGAKLLTLIMGVRFLTDYLMGDIYYKIHHPSHNLDRARTQFQLLQHIEAAESQMEEIVSRYIRVS